MASWLRKGIVFLIDVFQFDGDVQCKSSKKGGVSVVSISKRSNH